jgi:flagellar basal body-associated protein FliL
MDAVDAKVDTLTTQVDRVEGRIYSLLIMAIIQLMAIAGGVIGIWMVNHTTAVAAAETVVKAVIKP